MMTRTPLDAAWNGWMEEHPGWSVEGPEERGSQGNRFLPVRFPSLGWDGLLLRRPDGEVVVYLEGL